MENVLYEYSFNFGNLLLSVIPLVIGIAFFVNSVKLICEKKKKEEHHSFIDSLFKIAGLIIGPLGFGMFVMLVLGLSVEHKEYQQLIDDSEIQVVEGYVENYHPMPYEGHDTEHFEINGVYFEYSDYSMVNGYNVTASHGGVITHNGQRLKIKYVSKEYDGVSQNIILYIAQIEEADT